MMHQGLITGHRLNPNIATPCLQACSKKNWTWPTPDRHRWSRLSVFRSPTSVEIAPTSAEPGHELTDVGRSRPDYSRCRTNVERFPSASSGSIGQKCGEVGPCPDFALQHPCSPRCPVRCGLVALVSHLLRKELPEADHTSDIFGHSSRIRKRPCGTAATSERAQHPLQEACFETLHATQSRAWWAQGTSNTASTQSESHPACTDGPVHP